MRQRVLASGCSVEDLRRAASGGRRPRRDPSAHPNLDDPDFARREAVEPAGGLGYLLCRSGDRLRTAWPMGHRCASQARRVPATLRETEAMNLLRAAVVQAAPVAFDRDRSVEKVRAPASEAVDGGR
jgi:hypothetical protein